MKLSLIQIAVDFGHTHKGAYQPGPARQAPGLLAQALRETLPKHEITERVIDVPVPTRQEQPQTELKYEPELLALVKKASRLIADELKKGAFPIVLGGDHTVSLCTAVGISIYRRENNQTEKLGALVFDAHTDFNLPGEVSLAARPEQMLPWHTFSGNAHGMIHALLSGHAVTHFPLSAYCHEKSQIAGNQIAILGVRSQRYAQLEATLQDANPLLIPSAKILQADSQAKEKIAAEALACVTQKGVSPFYLSIDLDVLEPAVFPQVTTPVPQGLSNEDLLFFLRALANLGARKNLMALEIAEFLPQDGSKKAARGIASIIEASGLLGS